MLLFTHIAGNRNRAASGLLNPLHCLLRVLMLAQITDRDVRTLASKRDGDRPPNSRVATGNQSDTAFETIMALIGHFAVIRLRLELASLSRHRLLLSFKRR